MQIFVILSEDPPFHSNLVKAYTSEELGLRRLNRIKSVHDKLLPILQKKYNEDLEWSSFPPYGMKILNRMTDRFSILDPYSSVSLETVELSVNVN